MSGVRQFAGLPLTIFPKCLDNTCSFVYFVYGERQFDGPASVRMGGHRDPAMSHGCSQGRTARIREDQDTR